MPSAPDNHDAYDYAERLVNACLAACKSCGRLPD